VPSGNIATQVPASGASLKEGGLITVRLSQGAMPVAVPTSVIGVDCATATATLAHVGLVATCPLTVAVNSTTVPAGKVVKVFYGSQINPATVPKGSTVQLALSLGVSSPTTTTTTTPVNQHAPRAVPNFVGMSQSQVAAAMHLSEFFYRTNHPTGAWTVVVSQTPAPGTMLQWHGLVRLSVK
jgi:beta-lactam-binding protein with PASTA domain